MGGIVRAEEVGSNGAKLRNHPSGREEELRRFPLRVRVFELGWSAALRAGEETDFIVYFEFFENPEGGLG